MTHPQSLSDLALRSSQLGPSITFSCFQNLYSLMQSQSTTDTTQNKLSKTGANQVRDASRIHDSGNHACCDQSGSIRGMFQSESFRIETHAPNPRNLKPNFRMDRYRFGSGSIRIRPGSHRFGCTRVWIRPDGSGSGGCGSGWVHPVQTRPGCTPGCTQPDGSGDLRSAMYNDVVHPEHGAQRKIYF